MNKLLLNSEIDITKIKLVIWDLDNTFWKGLLGEHTEQVIDDNCSLVRKLTDKGIVNSICSKNNYSDCEKKLKDINMWDLFVFPSIDWSFKGPRVLQIIKEMNLRPHNVLFIDDEPINLQGVLAQEPNIMCAMPEEAIPSLQRQLDILKDDLSHKRLKQYQVLSVKVSEKKKCDSDIDFLLASDITINICYNCSEELTRIHELVNRTNQLNYTKERSSIEELVSQINSPSNKCAYITCRDKYGDYGLIGFYCLDINNNRLIHFLFSCRTLGMGIEQYVYKKLGCPQLAIVGEVVTELNENDSPNWIKEAALSHALSEGNSKKFGGCKMLLKGPCDLAQVSPFFSTGVDITEEFTYISQTTHRSIEAFNHTSQILLSDALSNKQKKSLIDNIELIDKEYFNTSLFSQYYDFVAISLLNDYSLGLYRNKKEPQLCLAFDQYLRDYTNKETWETLSPLSSISKYPCSEAFIEYFVEQWESIGIIDDDALISNLEMIRKKLPNNTHLILVNGAELPYNGHTIPEMTDRHLLHARLNKSVKEKFIDKHTNNCMLIDVNKYVKDQSYYTDSINHYKKIVYYNIAEEIRTYIESVRGVSEIGLKNTSYLKKEERKQWVNMLKRKIRSWFYN